MTCPQRPLTLPVLALSTVGVVLLTGSGNECASPTALQIYHSTGHGLGTIIVELGNNTAMPRAL